MISFFVLKTVAPVYITLGNHDLMALKGNKKGVKDLEWIENHHEEVMSALKNIRNVNILENRSVIIEEYNVLLTGINTDFAHYETTHEDPIEFSNEGIKAAAVTPEGGYGAGSCYFEHLYDVPVETIDLTFNKPYLFLIINKDTQEVWFVGSVYEPTTSEIENFEGGY